MDLLRTKQYVAFLIAIVLILACYSYPTLKTAATTGSRVLPSITAPDTSLYLNISAIRSENSREATDPYYGLKVPIARMGYLKFRTAFVLFHRMATILHGNLWWTLLVWNLFWWGLLCALAIWFFRRFLPEPSPTFVLFGPALLMFFNFGVLRNVVYAWVHLPNLRGFESVGLPQIRPFFPQLPIPLLLLYLGLQIKALQRKSVTIWCSMAVTQFLAFTIFPYAMLMMAGITTVAIFGQAISNPRDIHWRAVPAYASVCALSDLSFFFLGGHADAGGASGQPSLIHVQLAILPHRTGGMWFLLAAITLTVLFLTKLAPEVKWPIAGLGISTLCLLLGDVFLSEAALQVSQHAGYFVHFTATILTVFLVSELPTRITKGASAWSMAAVVVIALLAMNGGLVSLATYRQFLQANQEQADLIRSLQSNSPTEGDLVIARSLSVDDDCAWVPLIVRSHVLFCRNAQVLLSPEQNRNSQRFRQALYLYFTNKGRQWVEGVLNDPNAIAELTRLMFLGQVTTDPGDRQKGIETVWTDLIPRITEVEERQPAVRSFFSQFKQVIVIDSAAAPFFAESRLTNYFEIEHRERIGTLVILHCRPTER